MKRVALLAAIVAAAALAVVPTAGAGSSDPARGLRCVKAGVTTLVQLGLLRDALLRRVDYSDYDTDTGAFPDDVTSGPEGGPINTDLPNGSNLSLFQVVSLHYTNPELFDWCANV